MNRFIIHYVVVLFISTVYNLKSILTEIGISTPIFFFISLSLKDFSPFYYPKTLCFLVWWFYCSQQVYGSYILIQSFSPCLLIGELKILIFMIISEKYVLSHVILLTLECLILS